MAFGEWKLRRELGMELARARQLFAASQVGLVPPSDLPTQAEARGQAPFWASTATITLYSVAVAELGPKLLSVQPCPAVNGRRRTG